MSKDSKISRFSRHTPFIDSAEVDAAKEVFLEDLNIKVGQLANLVGGLPTSNYADVGKFHQKFDLPNTTFQGVFPREVNERFMQFRSAFLHEELHEFDEALAAGDLVKVFDALLDLAYVALGTAQILGLPWQSGWNEVQSANMAKERAQQDNQGTRPWEFDVKKPEGWRPPDIRGVLERFGWNESTLKFTPIDVLKKIED